VGRFLGRGSFLANKKHREIALNNLTLAYSNEKSPSEIRILAKKIFGNLGQIVFEIAWFWRLDRRDFHKHFRIDGLSHFTNALKKNKGVLLLTAHFGNWELMTVFSGVDWYEGVFVEFFGRLACTNKGLALLALRTEAPVVPIFLVREGAGFRVEIGQEVPLVKTGDKTKDIEAKRRYPDQWFWVHQRWKTRPYKPWPKI